MSFFQPPQLEDEGVVVWSTEMKDLIKQTYIYTCYMPCSAYSDDTLLQLDCGPFNSPHAKRHALTSMDSGDHEAGGFRKQMAAPGLGLGKTQQRG